MKKITILAALSLMLGNLWLLGESHAETIVGPLSLGSDIFGVNRQSPEPMREYYDEYEEDAIPVASEPLSCSPMQFIELARAQQGPAVGEGQAVTANEIVNFYLTTTGKDVDASEITRSLGGLARKISMATWLKIINKGIHPMEKQRVLGQIPASAWIDKFTAQDVARLLGGLRNYTETYINSPQEVAFHLEEAVLQTIPRAAYAKYTAADVAVITSALSVQCFHSICPRDVFKNLLAGELEEQVQLVTARETEEARSSYNWDAAQDVLAGEEFCARSKAGGNLNGCY